MMPALAAQTARQHHCVYHSIYHYSYYNYLYGALIHTPQPPQQPPPQQQAAVAAAGGMGDLFDQGFGGGTYEAFEIFSTDPPIF